MVKRKHNMKISVMETYRESNSPVAERLKNKAGSEKQDEPAASRLWMHEGLQFATLWLLFLTFIAAGWYLLLARILPFIVHWLHH